MRLEITAVTSSWTEITVHSANADALFEGWLQMTADWWVLYSRENEPTGEQVARWAGRRDYLSVLGDALKFIAKSKGEHA